MLEDVRMSQVVAPRRPPAIPSSWGTSPRGAGGGVGCCWSTECCGWLPSSSSPRSSCSSPRCTTLSGSYEQGYEMTWHFANYADALQGYNLGNLFVPLLPVCRDGDGLSASPLELSVRLRDCVGNRPVEERDACPGHRSVLHQFSPSGPWPAWRTVPLRRGSGGPTSWYMIAVAARGWPAAGHPGCGDRGTGLQLHAVHDPSPVRLPRQGRLSPDRSGRRPVRRRLHWVSGR